MRHIAAAFTWLLLFAQLAVGDSLYVKSGGVGVNTQNPNYSLHVVGSMQVENNPITGFVRSSADSLLVSNSGQTLQSTLDSNDLKFSRSSGDSYISQIQSSGRIRMTVGSSDLFILDSSTIYAEQPFKFDFTMSSGSGNPLCKDGSGLVVACNLTGGSGYSTQLCKDGSNNIGTCSSSMRYKENIHTYFHGMDVIGRLKPVSFNYKNETQPSQRYVGLLAEDVASVAPEFAIFEKGRIEGVRYDHLVGLLINGIKEQQGQIAALRQKLERLEATHVR
jgi:hypothetical protein